MMKPKYSPSLNAIEFGKQKALWLVKRFPPSMLARDVKRLRRFPLADKSIYKLFGTAHFYTDFNTNPASILCHIEATEFQPDLYNLISTLLQCDWSRVDSWLPDCTGVLFEKVALESVDD